MSWPAGFLQSSIYTSLFMPRCLPPSDRIDDLLVLKGKLATISDETRFNCCDTQFTQLMGILDSTDNHIDVRDIGHERQGGFCCSDPQRLPIGVILAEMGLCLIQKGRHLFRAHQQEPLEEHRSSVD